MNLFINPIYNNIKHNKTLSNKQKGNKKSILLNFDTLIKVIEKGTNKWKDIPCSLEKLIGKNEYYISKLSRTSIDTMQS